MSAAVQTLDISPVGRVEGDLDVRVDIQDGVVTTPGPRPSCSGALRSFCATRTRRPGWWSRRAPAASAAPRT